MKTSLSAVILAHNEIDVLLRCIKQLSFCDEVIVIDDSSTNQITQVAKKNNATVYKRNLANNFAEQRNFGLSKAKGDWILFVDPDEVVTKKLAQEIKDKIKNNNIDGYFLKRKDIWLGKKFKYGEVGETCLLRLARKSKGKWTRAVHEHWLIDGQTTTLKNSLLHYPHPTIYEFLEKINYYSQLHALENEKESKNASFIKILVYPLGKFIYYYFVKLGILDGIHGFVVAVIMSMHSFLSWGSIWSKQNYSKYSEL